VFEELVLVGSLFCGMSDMTRGRSFRLVWWWQLGLVHAMMLDIEHDLDAPKKYPQKDPDKTESTQRTNADPLVLMMLSSRNVTAS